MIIMSVDLGDARTGIALCDKNESMAFPKTVIHQRSRENLYAEIASAAAQYGAELIVVGCPKNMDGTMGFKAEECRLAAAEIEKKSGVKTVLYDERCTTISAHTALSYSGVYGQKRKNIVDEVAAVMILEDYLRYRKNTEKR